MLTFDPFPDALLPRMDIIKAVLACPACVSKKKVLPQRSIPESPKIWIKC